MYELHRPYCPIHAGVQHYLCVGTYKIEQHPAIIVYSCDLLF